MRWERIGSITGGIAEGIVGFDGGYVAWGTGDERFEPAVAWFSPDGRDWERIDLSRPVLNCTGYGPEGDEMVPDADVAAGASSGDMVMLVGEKRPHDAAACSGSDAYQGLSWVSTDGRTWQRSASFGRSTRATAVWPRADGWALTAEDGFARTSEDGQTWLDLGPLGTPEMSVGAAGVAPDGTWLASGFVPAGTPETDTLALTTSTDGRTWQPVPLPGGCEASISYLVPPGRRSTSWIVIGAEPADACAWEDIGPWPVGALAAPPDIVIHDLAVTRHGIIATGTTGCLDCPREGHQYLSADGGTFEEIPDAPIALRVTDGRDGVIGIGEVGVYRLVVAAGQPAP